MKNILEEGTVFSVRRCCQLHAEGSGAGGGVLFRWCFSIREGAVEIFLGGKSFCLVFFRRAAGERCLFSVGGGVYLQEGEGAFLFGGF